MSKTTNFQSEYLMKPRLHPKQRLTLVLIALFCTLAIVLGIVGIVFALDNPNNNYVFSGQSFFYYGIPVGKSYSILNQDWTNGISIDDFTIATDNKNFIVKGLQVYSRTPGRASISFAYKNRIVAVFKIDALENPILVDNQSAILASNSNLTYIQTADIELSSDFQASLTNCSYYGNYLKITKQDIKNGGLFSVVKNSFICGLRLKISGAFSGRLFGGIAHISEESNYIDNFVDGDITISTDGAENSIGGLFGQLYAEKFNTILESKSSLPTISYCTSNINISITAIGRKSYIGGIAGIVENEILENCDNFGAITLIQNLLPTDADEVIIGGIAARISGNDPLYPLTYGLYTGINLKGSGSIFVNSLGGDKYTPITIGGIAGILEDYNLSCSSSSANMKVITDGADVYVGGIIGQGKYSLPQSTTRMLIDKSEYLSTIELSTLGNVYAGSIAGKTFCVNIASDCSTLNANIVLSSHDPNKSINIGEIYGVATN
ncbi:MAG: hypothetical protein LBU04_05640 [Christensenellaceae bacterium]|nr:hypothetical protein [Christensenellaceae bacterium]